MTQRYSRGLKRVLRVSIGYLQNSNVTYNSRLGLLIWLNCSFRLTQPPTRRMMDLLFFRSNKHWLINRYLSGVEGTRRGANFDMLITKIEKIWIYYSNCKIQTKAILYSGFHQLSPELF